MELHEGEITVTDSVVDLTKAILSMWEWTHHPYVSKHFNDTGITREIFTETLFKEMRFVKEGVRKDLIMFAVKFKDKVVGMITVQGGSEISYNIVTAEENWKKGRAFTATTLVMDFLYQNGVKNIVVKFPDTNKAAKKFFKKLGFNPSLHILNRPCGER
jgi:RimJ/RimL family protein N-acetyltransferase